jgi:hypothetical protein
VELSFNGDNAYLYVQDQLDIGFRIPGTPERINCTNYFITKFQEIDANFSYFIHNFTVLSVNCQNVLFKLNKNESRIVILGAHYDTRAKATRDPNPLNRTDPVPGANDGASGSAVLIELANTLYQNRGKISSQVWFLFFDAEDQGRDNAYGINGWGWVEGSKAFVNEIDNFYEPETEVLESMILLDMVGGTNLQFIKEQYSTSSLLDELFAIGRELGYKTQFPSNPTKASITDDHRAFLDMGVPSADLIINFWDNPNWPYHHTIQDDLSHISSNSLEITGRTIEQFIYNNFLNTTNDGYVGNYPWSEDINWIDLEIIVILIITISLVAIVILVINIFKVSSASNKSRIYKGKSSN